MYQKVNIIPSAIKEAEKFVLDNDRMLYAEFLKLLEQYCSENSILLGGKIGIDLLLSKPLTKDSFVYEIYSDDTFNHAKKLADRLYEAHCPHIDKRYITLQTNIRYREFTISINTRQMIKIYNLDKYRNIKLIDLMGPVQRRGYFYDGPIKCISEEIQLIEIYRALYTPSKLTLWADYLASETELWGAIAGIVAKKAVERLPEPSIQSTGDFIGAADPRLRWKQHIDDLIIDKIVRKSDNVLIGDYAIEWSLDYSATKSDSRLQLISAESIDDLVAKISRVLKSNRINGSVSYVKYPLNLPTDFQIIKYTIYITNDKNQVPLLDMFNSTSFELIPYRPGDNTFSNIKVGNIFVLLRFKFIDLWVMRLILNIGSDSPDFLKNRINDILSQIKMLRGVLSTKPKEELFQLTNYAGQYINETVAKKKLITERGEKFPIYFPARQKK